MPSAPAVTTAPSRGDDAAAVTAPRCPTSVWRTAVPAPRPGGPVAARRDEPAVGPERDVFHRPRVTEERATRAPVRHARRARSGRCSQVATREPAGRTRPTGCARRDRAGPASLPRPRVPEPGSRSTPALATSRPDGANAAAVTPSPASPGRSARAGRQREDASAGLACDHDHRRARPRLDDEPLDRPGTRGADGWPIGAPVSASSAAASGVRSRGRCGRPGRTPLPAPSTRFRPELSPVSRSIMRATLSASTTSRASPLRSSSDEGPADVDRSHARGTRRATGAGRPPPEASGRPPPPRAPNASAELRVAPQQRQRARDQLPALRDPRLLARVAPLGEREDGERGGGERKADERAEGEEAKPTMPAACFVASALQPPVPPRGGSSSRARRRRGRRGRSPTDRTRPSAGCGGSRASPHRLDGVLRRARELGQIGGLVRDLRPRRRDEVVEEACGDLALVGRQRVDRAFEMIGDDLPAPPSASSVATRNVPILAALDVPEALHDELEVRRLDPSRRTVLLDDPDTARAELDAARHRRRRGRVRRGHPRRGPRRPRARSSDEGAHDRRPSGRAVEPVESEDVARRAAGCRP